VPTGCSSASGDGFGRLVWRVQTRKTRMKRLIAARLDASADARSFPYTCVSRMG
jgi:hypothetical protein